MKIRLPKVVIGKKKYSFGMLLLIGFSLSLGLFIFSINKFEILPSVFFGDHKQILKFSQTVTNWSTNGYLNTGMFYKILGLTGSLNILVVFSFTVCLGAFIYLLMTAPVIDFSSLIILFLFLSLSSVFLQQYSKDFFVLVMIMAMIAVGFRHKILLVLFIVFAFGYAYYFRKYWGLVLLTYIGFNCIFLLFKIRPTRKNIVLLIFAFMLMLSLAFEVILNVGLSHYRMIININRIGDVNATSIILPFIPLGNFLLEWVNSLITMIMLLLPFPLLALGGIQHVVSFIAISFVYFTFFKDLKFAVLDSVGKQAALFLISFVMIQSVFEPDYGSFLRHLTPLLPLVLVVHYRVLMMRNK